MNTFATIKQIAVYEKVRYYSILFEGEKNTEYEKFILNHASNQNIKDEFFDLLHWITLYLGERFGAQSKYFRHEGAANALPPNAQYLKLKYEENLRLYCYRISDHVVILFNGGIKTKGVNNPQDCEVVKPHFENANKLSHLINNAFTNKEILLSEDQKILLMNDDFEIMF